MEAGNSYSQPLLDRLVQAQAALEGNNDAVVAKRYAATVLNEAVMPLEAINNLVYIVKQAPANSEILPIYLEMIEVELRRLIGIVQQTLRFCSE